jgi:hypothetical protein
MRRFLAAAILLVLAAPIARAQPPAAPPGKKSAQPSAGEPLSPEDAALVRELALLERVELLKNLELFEPPRAQPRKKKSQLQ